MKNLSTVLKQRAKSTAFVSAKPEFRNKLEAEGDFNLKPIKVVPCNDRYSNFDGEDRSLTRAWFDKTLQIAIVCQVVGGEHDGKIITFRLHYNAWKKGVDMPEKWFDDNHFTHRDSGYAIEVLELKDENGEQLNVPFRIEDPENQKVCRDISNQLCGALGIPENTKMDIDDEKMIPTGDLVTQLALKASEGQTFKATVYKDTYGDSVLFKVKNFKRSTVEVPAEEQGGSGMGSF